jgi:DNA polymerase III sliding clamp (beta) subunit (PCNA family)
MITKYKNTIKLSKLIDGVYPDIEPLIPNSFKYLLSINSDELQNLIDRVTVLSEEINKPIKIFINKNQIILKSERKEMGNIEVQSHNHK